MENFRPEYFSAWNWKLKETEESSDISLSFLNVSGTFFTPWICTTTVHSTRWCASRSSSCMMRWKLRYPYIWFPTVSWVQGSQLFVLNKWQCLEKKISQLVGGNYVYRSRNVCDVLQRKASWSCILRLTFTILKAAWSSFFWLAYITIPVNNV